MSEEIASVNHGWGKTVIGLLLAMTFQNIHAAGQQSRPGSPGPTSASSGPVDAHAGEDSLQYIIGPGDTIQVFVWRNPELSVTIPVRPDGKISTPLVEDLVAVGRTPSELARDIEGKLSDYVRSPQVNVIVSNAVGAVNQIKVVGQVKTPSAIPYHQGMTILDLVIAVGGLTDFAAGNRAKILRKDAKGNDVQIKVRLDSLMKSGKLSENVPLMPGDVVVVPEAIF
jgi:polysaccharide export outer membrane protein